MNISEWLFAILLFLAIVPAYAFAFYGLYIARLTSGMVGKILEQDMSSALGAAQGGMGTPVYKTSLSMEDFHKIINEGKGPKKVEGDNASKPTVGGGQYL